jgi:hypothetical protein
MSFNHIIFFNVFSIEQGGIFFLNIAAFFIFFMSLL